MRRRILVGLFVSCTAAAQDRLEALAHDGDRGVRYAAVTALGKAGAGEAALAAALRDPEWCVRAEAAVALARIGPRALPLVLEAARDPDREVRLEAWTALRKMGPDAVRAGHEALRKGLVSLDVEERLEAARCLVLLGPSENDALLPAVLAALEGEKDPDLVCRAAWILRTVGPPGAKAAPTLEAYLADDKWKDDAFRQALEAVKPPATPTEPRLTEEEARTKLASEFLDEVLDGAIALEGLGMDPRPLLAERDDLNAARVFVILGPAPTPPPERWLSAEDDVVRECAAIALGQRGIAAKAFVDPDPRVRAAAVWSHGRAGVPVPEKLRDTDPVIREMAVRTLGPRELGTALVGDDLAVRRLAANRCAEDRILVPELLSAARSEDHDLRILATRALSRCGEPFLPALMDTSRAVRMEAVLGLSDRHEAQLLRALADEDWRIRRAALRRLGRSKRAAEAAAPFVADVNPLLSEAAADALSRMGADAAAPLSRMLPGANEAVHYHAPRILEALGKDGAAAAPALVPLLRNPDVNVREFAARCLAPIGARDASAALVEALGDPRLCVVSHAALALGRIGVTPELERALGDPRARVRAYAAFAYGWARGAERGIDQVPFEVRLPVLDCGQAPPGKFAELRSKDPAVAIPCAAARHAEELDAWESERVMELLLCGAGRPDAPGNFHNYRNVLGSAELPAQMQYLVRARRTAAGKSRIFGENHRIARKENIPAILWFQRTEDDDALNGVDGIHMPFTTTDDVSLYVREERGRRGPGLPPALREWLAGKGDIEESCALWWLDEVTPLASDAPTLLDFARRESGPSGDAYRLAVAVRALAKLRDPESERFLREVEAGRWKSEGGLPVELLATASLARRGDPGALRGLLDDDEFTQLLEAAPGFAVARLRERLLDPAQVHDACRLVRSELDDSYLGARLEETLFAGVAEAAIASGLDSRALARIAVTLPGGRRKAVAEAALARLSSQHWHMQPDDRAPDFDAAALLLSADPQRFTTALRAWASGDAEARAVAIPMLLRIGDPGSAAMLVEAAPEEYELLARMRAPEIEEHLAEHANDGGAAVEGLFAYLGFRWRDPQGARATLERARRGEAIPAMVEEMDRTEERLFDFDLGLVKDPRVLAWLRKERLERRFDLRFALGALVLAGDRDAREELWSMVRCGRHRLLYGGFEEQVFTLDWDFSTLPHWIEELDSNCCRVAGGLESLFEEKLDGTETYNRPWSGLGEPRSRRARTELLRHGGRFVWSPLVDGFVAAPD